MHNDEAEADRLRAGSRLGECWISPAMALAVRQGGSGICFLPLASPHRSARTIQELEQGRKDVNRAGIDALMPLAAALSVDVEALVERVV